MPETDERDIDADFRGALELARDQCHRYLRDLPPVGSTVTWQLGRHRMSGTVASEPRTTPEDIGAPYMPAASVWGPTSAVGRTITEMVEALDSLDTFTARGALDELRYSQVVVPVRRPRGITHSTLVTELGYVAPRAVLPDAEPNWPVGRGTLPAWLADHPPSSTADELSVLAWPAGPSGPLFPVGSARAWKHVRVGAGEPVEALVNAMVEAFGWDVDGHLWSIVNLATGAGQAAPSEDSDGPWAGAPWRLAGEMFAPCELGRAVYDFGASYEFGLFVCAAR